MDRPERISGIAWLVVGCAGALGLGLMTHATTVSSATYDEVAYLDLAAQWWRGGGTETITRMGSPVTFFKLQAGPVFWVLDQLGYSSLINDALPNQSKLLPLVRMGSLWIWFAAFGLTVGWSGKIHGVRAMIAAAILFAMSPNLLAHGSIATMEMPLIATSTALVFLFDHFLRTGHRWAFIGSAAVAGLAFSCKFTTVLWPPILAILWLVDLGLKGNQSHWKSVKIVGLGMIAYGLILILANLIITGFAVLPLSQNVGDHPSVQNGFSWLLEIPLPQDWVGFATQIRHQKNGGPSYLFGQRRMTGWWYYYPVALAVKLPLSAWLLIAGRGWLAVRRRDVSRDWVLPLAIAIFLGIAMAGSKRNYGVRYLLPLAPLAIVWVSALGQRAGGWRWILGLGLIGQTMAVLSIHPHELSYFNEAAGGTRGGRRILADSNLDWGQGLRSLARLESQFTPLTLYYFGDTDPAYYGIKNQAYLITANETRPELPLNLEITTRFVAVSASLQYGPWGPEGYFDRLNTRVPVAFTDDGTIAIYDTFP